MRAFGFIFLSAILGVFCLSSCASTAEEKRTAKKDAAEEETVGPPVAEELGESAAGHRQERTLARDEREKDGNFLELLDQRQQTIEELKKRVTLLEGEARDARDGLAKVRESENMARTETERVQGMLQDALIREKSLQEQVLHARLDAVRMEKELYRAKIASLTGSDSK